MLKVSFRKWLKRIASVLTACEKNFASILLLPLLFLGLFGCTVSPATLKETGQSLVSHEHPIFDKRFQTLSFKDLDLRNLWVEGGDHANQKVPIHNNTFAEIVEAAKDGVVNIYTRRLEEREAKFGVSPKDILP